ncbi:MAG: hypothetical protein ACREPM_00025 [Gemmatimonadaceae bacterium]
MFRLFRLFRFGSIAVVAGAASVALLALPPEARAHPPARAAQSDSRWDAWLGCWGVDTAAGGGRQQTSANVVCIVPVANSHAVEALTIARGKIVARDRLDASGEPHTVSGQGCRGFETIDWSSTGRRALLHSDYVCGSSKGASSTIYAIAADGDWLRVQQVRSGSGMMVTVERRHAIGMLAEVPADAAHAIDDRRLAIVTARAAAAAPITPDEVVEAIHIVDPGAVRSWIVASGQSFDLDGASLASLIRADVPQSVLDAMMPSERPLSAPALEQRNAGGYYYSNPPAPMYGGATGYTTIAPQEVEGNYGCPSMSCNAVPNPYSILNGYGVSPYGYGYGAYPYSPFGSGFPGGVIITNSSGNGRLSGHRPSGRQPSGRKPVGRGPVIVAGGGRRR